MPGTFFVYQHLPSGANWTLRDGELHLLGTIWHPLEGPGAYLFPLVFRCKYHFYTCYLPRFNPPASARSTPLSLGGQGTWRPADLLCASGYNKRWCSDGYRKDSCSFCWRVPDFSEAKGPQAVRDCSEGSSNDTTPWKINMEPTKWRFGFLQVNYAIFWRELLNFMVGSTPHPVTVTWYQVYVFSLNRKSRTKPTRLSLLRGEGRSKVCETFWSRWFGEASFHDPMSWLFLVSEKKEI